ncbi:hypothetical protein CEXT_79931 [Caerostris extrusa]|uniref:Uncharacterized protein n=1 Tax=Caerostris extrusa TaxID=172846 RepID=A0AAV4THF7_CAEEX|nr:hypothetical protein CEXT_79931 [Caerostris extrusa]
MEVRQSCPSLWEIWCRKDHSSLYQLHLWLVGIIFEDLCSVFRKGLGVESSERDDQPIILGGEFSSSSTTATSPSPGGSPQTYEIRLICQQRFSSHPSSSTPTTEKMAHPRANTPLRDGIVFWELPIL